MKSKWCYILAFAVICSCKNTSENMDVPMMESVENVADVVEISQQQAQLFLVEQRLQEQLDIAKLKSDHPDFETRVQNINLLADNVSKNAKIEALRILESSTKGDSMLLKIALRLKNGTEIQNDTILATLVSRTMQIEGEKIVSKKVFFE